MADLPERTAAAWIDRPGPVDAIRVGELPLPAVGSGEALVRVEAVAVNAVDTLVRSGAYPTPMSFPFVIGRDLAGTVVAVPDDGSAGGFAEGDRVWCNSMGHDGRPGAAAEYVAVPVERLYPLPEQTDAVTAVAVVHPAATAHLALFTHGRLRSTDTVFVAGAAGNVGAAAVRMASAAGARVIASAGRPDLEYCRSLGASLALDYHAPDLAERIRAAAPDGVDVYMDTSGRNDLTTAVELLAVRGRILVLAGLGRADGDPPLPVGPLYTKDASVLGFVISRARTTELAAAAERVNELLSAGMLSPRRIELLPLSAAAEAHRRVESGEAHGIRLVLRP
ncbi:NADPH:quinone reductase [Allostreptomyces psammosilenae]|uniref:NADPH:quinone reductase-like Zn-dependent oxidoreductase n=1 Tax=Allostreptomyces psammosilenae TaxID=1892865 RepID=A0A853A1J3_9ACTN|nr:NADPH:quinone reductase [Allostreptomyces psammosilenae]NYI06784.1 NADPH:quinone reductase-like Zn-dependent oxidoreductase [Allostreptomyces psammosilenae]